MISKRFKLVAVSALLTALMLLIVVALFVITFPKPSDPFLEPNLVWAGIIPGSTTVAEAQRLLEAQYGKDKVTISRDSISWKDDDPKDKSGSGQVQANDQGIVTEVDVFFSKNQMRVSEFIAQFGEPSFVWVVRAFSSEAKCAGSSISYPNRGANAWLYPVGPFVGVQSTQFIESLQLLPLDQAKQWTITDSVQLKWQGYTDYCNLW